MYTVLLFNKPIDRKDDLRIFMFNRPFFIYENSKGKKRWMNVRCKFIVITNNPLVLKEIGRTHTVVFKEISFEETLKEVRDRIHQGHTLLSHPLSGSVKPNETPYKSVMISEGKEEMDQRSVMLIEHAIEACGKFSFKSDKYQPEVYADFQMIDWTLLQSAISSAEAC